MGKGIVQHEQSWQPLLWHMENDLLAGWSLFNAAHPHPSSHSRICHPCTYEVAPYHWQGLKPSNSKLTRFFSPIFSHLKAKQPIQIGGFAIFYSHYKESSPPRGEFLPPQMITWGWYTIHLSYWPMNVPQQLVRSWPWIFRGIKLGESHCHALFRVLLWHFRPVTSMSSALRKSGLVPSATRCVTPWAVWQGGQWAQVANVAFHQQEKMPWQRGAELLQGRDN